MNGHWVLTSGTSYLPADEVYEGRVVCACGASFEAVEPTRQFAIDRARSAYLMHKEER